MAMWSSNEVSGFVSKDPEAGNLICISPLEFIKRSYVGTGLKSETVDLVTSLDVPGKLKSYCQCRSRRLLIAVLSGPLSSE